VHPIVICCKFDLIASWYILNGFTHALQLELENSLNVEALLFSCYMKYIVLKEWPQDEIYHLAFGFMLYLSLALTFVLYFSYSIHGSAFIIYNRSTHSAK